MLKTFVLINIFVEIIQVSVMNRKLKKNIIYLKTNFFSLTLNF